MSYETWNYNILYFTPLDVKNITLNHKTVYMVIRMKDITICKIKS